MFSVPDIELPHLIIAALTGFISGFLVSFPVGPINLTILNEGARRGFRWAILIAAGAVLMETIYCTLAFMGASTFFTHATMKAAVELISFLLMLYLGIKFLRAKAVVEHSRIEGRIEEKLHPHSAFMTGFVRVLGNPGVLILWVTLTATFVSHDWVGVNYPEKVACILGVCLGTATWFLLLSYTVSLGHKRFSPKTLLVMEHISGAILLLVAVALGVRLVLLIEGNRRNHRQAKPPAASESFLPVPQAGSQPWVAAGLPLFGSRKGL
jgi:threonine/homoserine/homoserine lactone efflux protein